MVVEQILHMAQSRDVRSRLVAVLIWVTDGHATVGAGIVSEYDVSEGPGLT